MSLMLFAERDEEQLLGRSQVCLPQACVDHFSRDWEVSKACLALHSAAPPSDCSQLLQGLWGQSLLSTVAALGPARERLLDVFLVKAAPQLSKEVASTHFCPAYLSLFFHNRFSKHAEVI